MSPYQLAWSLGATVAIAFAVGFRLHGSALDGLAAFGLVVAFGFVFEWLFSLVGLRAGSGQPAQGMGMIVFPFAFVSSAYAPVSSMPAGSGCSPRTNRSHTWWTPSGD